LKVESKGNSGRRVNLDEIEAIKNDIDNVIAQGYKGTIGVICSFQDQKDRMEEIFRKEMKIHPDLFISSPANRAIETAEIIAKCLGHSAKKIEKTEKLYNELPPEGFLELIKSLDDKVDSAILFGHDPAFTDFARFLVSGFDSDLPKAGVLGVQVDVAVWADVKPELARKVYFFYPGDTAVAKEREREVRRELGTKIETSLASAVADFGIVGGEDLTEKLRRVSTKLAKQLAPRAKGARR